MKRLIARPRPWWALWAQLNVRPAPRGQARMSARQRRLQAALVGLLIVALIAAVWG